MYMYVSLAMCMCGGCCPQKPKRASDQLELELVTGGWESPEEGEPNSISLQE